MVRYFFGVIIVGVLVQFVLSSGLGKCPKQDPMNDFNMTKFTGRWYEIERTFHMVELLYSCVTVEMDTVSNFKLNISVISKSRWSDGIVVSEGFATQTRRDPAIFVYKVNSKLPRLISRYLPGAGAYQILDTDYDTYAILWSCTDYLVAHNDVIWIWGRQRELNVTTRANIYEILEMNQLDPERLTIPKNGNCMN